ncbi:glutathione S-transferase [Rhyzopertha dominica]|nr:glutathione S-transferase [Rhyzopertha dominica]
MAPKLYMIVSSTPVRSILMTADSLGIELELQKIDFINGEHKTPEYTKMNPQHTIPLLDDDGYFLADSHAINAYLVGKYGKDDSLYPKDLKKRGKVDERLHFDNGTLLNRLGLCLLPVLFGEKQSIEQKNIDLLHEAYSIIEKFLEENEWIAGDNMTIADFSAYATMSAANIAIPVNASKYMRLAEWMKRMESLPATSGLANKGLKTFKKFAMSKLSK